MVEVHPEVSRKNAPNPGKNLRALILLGEEKLQILFAFGNVSILSGKSEDIAETFK